MRKQRYKSTIVLCISFFLLSMLPIHYMPPIYANQNFLVVLLDNINIHYYLYAYLVGFILCGIFLLANSTNNISTSLCLITILGSFVTISLSILCDGWWAIVFRFLSGFFGCILYTKMYIIIYEVNGDNIHLVGRILGLSSILLESSAFLSGVIANINSNSAIRSSYVLLILFTSVVAFSQIKGRSSVNVNIVKPSAKKYVAIKKNIAAMLFIIPSVLAFSAFFMFMLNIGYAAKATISPFYIGLVIFSLAVAFPFGTFIAKTVFERLAYKRSLLLFSILPLVGISIQVLGINYSLWLYLMLGACLMAIGNGGIITINSARSLTIFQHDPSRSPLFYMISAMAITLIFGVSDYSIENKFIFSMVMFFLYILILLFVLSLPKDMKGSG